MYIYYTYIHIINVECPRGGALPRFGANVNDHRCDVCGESCTAVLYEFRCFKRLPLGSDESRSAVCTALSPIQRKNVKRGGFLGVQSELTKVRERLLPCGQRPGQDRDTESDVR